MTGKRIAIRVKPAAERALRQGHPWVFDQAITHQSHDGQPGDLAVIFDQKRRFLAIGLYDPDSPIRVKVLQHGQPATIDADWFAGRLAAALGRRAPLLAQDTDGCRLVHGENDGLPGLVLDQYATTLVLKLYTAAWLPHLEALLAGLPPAERLVLRLGRSVQASRDDLRDGQILRGDAPDSPVIFRENGLRFAADVVQGHKTGFFFDQRDNRARVRELAAGAYVLDVFAYSGGFSVYAAAGGARHVTSVDSSRAALDAAAANLALNELATPHVTLAEDAFAALERLHTERYDLVIVDPPSFAKSAAEINGALAAYARLAGLALPLVAPGGVFVMASCSSRVTAEAFFDTIHRAASSFALTEIARTGHALDHPVGFPEGAYLKCLFARRGS